MKKIPFDLSKWLSDKSQKVVNSEGKDVRIICWDREGKWPIIGLTENRLIQQYDENGVIIHFGGEKWEPDLFLVTEDEPMTEFEQAVKSPMIRSISYEDAKVREEAKELLSIARKQLEAEKQRKPSPALTKIVENLTPEKLEKTKKEMEHDIWVEAYVEGEKHGMEVGRKQVLQGLPKWKKAPRCHSPLAELLGDQLHYKGYYIKLSDLEKLLKKE